MTDGALAADPVTARTDSPMLTSVRASRAGGEKFYTRRLTFFEFGARSENMIWAVLYAQFLCIELCGRIVLDDLYLANTRQELISPVKC